MFYSWPLTQQLLDIFINQEKDLINVKIMSLIFSTYFVILFPINVKQKPLKATSVYTLYKNLINNEKN